MSYDVYWVKNRAEKIADFEHPTRRDTDASVIRNFVPSSSFRAYLNHFAELELLSDGEKIN